MKYTILVLLFLSSSLLANTKIRSTIVNIDFGDKGEEPMLFLASGQVAFYPTSTPTTQKYLLTSSKQKYIFDFTLDNKQGIIGIQKVGTSHKISSQDKSMILSYEPYTPTLIPSIEKAIELFSQGRRDSKQVSQCYNRAHIWSYEWEKKYEVQTSKVWLFFTRKYIRRYRFEWWFHVAPTVLVKIGEDVKERVMDIKYLNAPSTIKQWTNVFIRNRSNCPIIEKFSDYTNFPESSLCYIQRSNPYFYQPVDLERYEYLGEEKLLWQDSDVSEAYLEAFDIKESELL